ncbi:SDR family NAD(P)-dependent oxidoreductase [Proteiniclasticum sp. C24MP]|uniref:SDR family NAD(P)-dependent oxidoreductase n=1 Tax=Proteiniclasticum sp. C24MP TaxID=3374101 RepID=UPI003754A7EC
MNNLKDKWVLVTGASRGLGQLISAFMAEQGCNMILHGRNLKNLEQTAEMVKKQNVKVHMVTCELSDLHAIDGMLQAIDILGVDVDLVFNNAGFQIGYHEDYYKTPDDDFLISYKVNTVAPIKICYHFLPKMIEKGFGRIINTTSDIANEPQQAGYSASKAALDKLTVDLAGKLTGTGVTLNLVNPSWCQTDLGGPHAPNTPESALPGLVLPAFSSDEINGQLINAQDFRNRSLSDALLKLEN